MIRGTCAHPPGHQVDQADIISMPTMGGARVELMRTTYHRQAFPRHSHEYLTFGVMLRGVGTLWLAGSDHRMHRGDVVVIPPGQVHTGGMERGTKVLSYLAVHVPAEVIALCADSHGFRGGNAPVFGSPIIRDADVAGALRRVDAATRGAPDAKGVGAPSGSGASPPFDASAADDALTTAIDLLVARHADSPAAGAKVVLGPEPRLVRTAREIIEDCYADVAETSLRTLADRTGVTPFHLVRAFTQATGLSPHRYVVQVRVRHAARLLAGGMPSSLVAAMTGFVDQSHLTTQFKRYVGTTPASYQRGVTGQAGRAPV